MNQARRAGLIGSDLDPETGEYAPAITITVPSIFSIPQSQRKARIAPAMIGTVPLFWRYSLHDGSL